MNINIEEALKIANSKLRESYYKEKLEEGWIYGILDFELDYKEIEIEGKEAYYIYVVGGTFGAKRDSNYKIKETGLFSKVKFIDGEWDEDSNIKCIVYKKDGKYIYLNK